MTGYKPMQEYPSLSDKVMHEIFGQVIEICPFCGTKFTRKAMEKHVSRCEISTVFDTLLIAEVEHHQALSFIKRDIGRHSAFYLFEATHIFDTEFNPDIALDYDKLEAEAYARWESRTS